MGEQGLCKPKVVGSSPTISTNMAGVVKWSNTEDCGSSIRPFESGLSPQTNAGRPGGQLGLISRDRWDRYPSPHPMKA